jgi:hypothetical protein
MFRSEFSLHAHIRNIHKEVRWLECKKCSKKYIDMPSYLKHKCVVHAPRSPRPDSISKTGKRLKLKRKKANIFPYFCEPCNLEISCSGNLNKHINESKSHWEVMDKLDGLENFEPTSSEEMPEEPAPPGIFCPKCPEWFETDNHLIVHLVNHGLTYKCDVCSETVTEWSNIYQHLLTHLSPGYENADITHNAIANISPASIL